MENQTISQTTDLKDLVIEEYADQHAAVFAELLETRRDRDAYRLIALQALAYVTELQRDLSMTSSRQYVYQQHVLRQVEREAA